MSKKNQLNRIKKVQESSLIPDKYKKKYINLVDEIEGVQKQEINSIKKEIESKITSDFTSQYTEIEQYILNRSLAI